MGSAGELEIDEKLGVFYELSLQKAWGTIMAIKSSESSPVAY